MKILYVLNIFFYLCSIMNNKELNNELRTKAIANGLCKQWQNEWKEDWDQDKMIRQFYRGLDFFLKRRFMSNDFMKQNFDIKFRRENGVLVDDKYSLMNPETALLIGNSESTIRVNGCQASHVYVLDDSKIKVYAKNKSFVIVHALGSAQIEAKAYDSARLVVIQHSHDIKLNVDENIVLKEEFDYLKDLS